jgi:Big-like domain-containing protein
MRVFVLIVAFGLACGGDSSGPSGVPNALVQIAGDGQAALTGTALATPLRVRVNGSNGQPYAGAPVTWTVLSGTATLGTPSAVSDSQGFAATTVTLGATPGALAVRASVTGITPVTFGATACDHPALALNDTVPGALATSDCRFSGYYTDFFDLSVPAGSQSLVITMEAPTFNTYAELYTRTLGYLGYGDDIDTSNTNTQLTAIVATGDYLIAPSSFDLATVGTYSLSVTTQQPALAGCELVWATRGVSITDSLTPDDCVDSGGGTYYADAVALWLVGGSVLKVSNHSTAFDAAIFLQNASGFLVAANDDSAVGTTDAYLAYSVPVTGPYLLLSGSNDSLTTGAYTLAIAAATTLNSPPRAAGAMRMPERLVRRGWRQ